MDTPKSKQRGKVAIPAELRQALREVLDLIRAARYDPNISLDFDDAIQCDSICGGRNPRDRKRFDLTYYPSGSPKCRWYLTLHKLEIEDIADGFMKELTLWSCADSDCDCKFRDANAFCPHCDRPDDPS